ncbi:MAG: hypothetical protein EBR35_02365 [Flavobacteriales bacterium]|nr:hypothetical protein [Flavobacteriales bacterium]
MKRQFLILLLLTILICSCKKKQTTWNTDWSAPIISDTISLSNLYNDSTLVSSNQTTIDLDLSRTILNLGLSDLVGFPDTTINQSFNLNFSLSNVPAGYTFANTIEEHSFDLNDVQLKKVDVSSGTIKLKVFNSIATKVYFKIILPGITKNGLAFEQIFFVNAGTNAQPGSAEELLDISGYSFDLRGVNGLGYNKLQSQLIITSDPTGPSVAISSNNDFSFSAELSGLKFSYAKGYFGNTLISETAEFLVPYFNSIVAGNLDLPSANLDFEIENGMKFGIKGKIVSAENTNSSGNTSQLVSSNLGNDFLISPATGAWNSLQTSSQHLIFSATNSNIESYLENFGSSHQLAYQLQLNPWGNVSGGNDEIFSNSRLKIKIKSQIPLIIGADGLTLRDTFNIDLKQNSNKTHAKSGLISLSATNAFPLACEPILYLLNENGTILNTINATSQIYSSLLGSLNTQSGLFEKSSLLEFVLTEDIVENLDKIKKIVVQAKFDTPNPLTGWNEAQSIPFGAFLAVKLRLKLNAEIVY